MADVTLVIFDDGEKCRVSGSSTNEDAFMAYKEACREVKKKLKKWQKVNTPNVKVEGDGVGVGTPC